jgi:hypothetical protein
MRVPGNVHDSFTSHLDAERAYVLAYALGAVRVLQPRNGWTRGTPAAAAPIPEAIMVAWAQAGDNFLGSTWYVVFKGICMGIFLSW